MSADDDTGTGKIHYLSSPDDSPIAKCRPIDFIRFQDKAVPERDWLVPGYIPMKKVTILYGPSGDGKTTIVQQLMTAAALGQEWLGLPVKRVRSLGVFCEDDQDDVHIRQFHINRHYGCDFSDLEDMKALAQLGENNALMTFDRSGVGSLTDLHLRIMNVANADDFGAQLLIIDTAADVFPGNHNDPSQARQFVQRALGGMGRQLNAAVVLCAHPSRSGRETGAGDGASVQWDATSRSRLYLTRPKVTEGEEEDPDARLLERKKANYAAAGDALKLRWENGVFIRDKSDTNTGIIGSINRRACETKFLDLMDEASRQGRQLSATPTAGTYAPRVFMKKPKDGRGGFGLRDFERAMEALLDARELKIENSGPPSKPRSQLVRKDGPK